MKKKRFFILSIMIILLLGAMFVITEKSSEDTSMKYQKALNYIKEKKYPQAMGVLRDIQDYNNSRMIQEQLLYIMNGSYIGNGIWAVGALTPKGGVQVAYSGEGKPYSDVNSWENIKSISFLGGDSIEGLTEEGKIITTSTITKEELEGSKVTSAYEMSDVVKAVSEWKNVKAFQTYYPQAAGALDKDGFVYVAYPHFEKGLEKLKGWEGIVAIQAGTYFSIGLKSDGTIVLSGDSTYSGAETPDVSNMKGLYVPTIIIP